MRLNSVLLKITFGNKGKRRLFSVIRILLIVVFFVAAVTTIPEMEPIENKVYKDDATNAALRVFHNEVKLKNEDSFVLNDSEVTYKDSYNGNNDLALVKVVLDYSAQNGFGGTNRDEYVVNLIFNYALGTYSPLY